MATKATARVVSTNTAVEDQVESTTEFLDTGMDPETMEREARINALKQLLANTDHEAIKAYEGYVPQTDAAALNDLRQSWRAELTALKNTQTLEEKKKTKLAEISIACQRSIFSGISVGAKRYSLTEHDQIELMGQADAIKQGAAAVPYHADGELCRLVPAEELLEIATTATKHIFFNRTYCNHINAWVRRAETMEELDSIAYSGILDELPSDLKESLDTLLQAAQS